MLVQVTKDPIGHKGARLTSHVALSGRHLVYVPNGNASGISRKLPDTERKRLRDVLKKLVPDGAGVIVRTAAEGASEDELARDVKRLQAQWEDIQAKAAEGGAPVLLYEEPDLVIRVVRDLFNEDFRELVIAGRAVVRAWSSRTCRTSRRTWSTGCAGTSAPPTSSPSTASTSRSSRGWTARSSCPPAAHLVIDRTEAMTVIDVNTGKYTGAGGNLEETVTRNNLEAAEEIVRQLRLRDIGGIVVIDFIDMVLESNRELVLRRLTECLGRDRTKHQVTEITSLGLVQMTRKRIGAGPAGGVQRDLRALQGPGPDHPHRAGAGEAACRQRRRGRPGQGGRLGGRRPGGRAAGQRVVAAAGPQGHPAERTVVETTETARRRGRRPGGRQRLRRHHGLRPVAVRDAEPGRVGRVDAPDRRVGPARGGGRPGRARRGRRRRRRWGGRHGPASLPPGRRPAAYPTVTG